MAFLHSCGLCEFSPIRIASKCFANPRNFHQLWDAAPLLLQTYYIKTYGTKAPSACALIKSWFGVTTAPHPTAYLSHRLPPGEPAAPRKYYLPLLSSEPDRIHSFLPRRTRCSLPMGGRHSRKVRYLEQESDPAIADCGYRAPLSPP